MSIAGRLIKTGIAAFAYRIVKTFDQLLLVPIYLSVWGTGYYGEWLTLMAVPTVIGFSEFGFGAASSSAFVLKYTSGQIQEAADTAKSGFFAITAAIFAALLLCCLVIIFVDANGYFDHFLIARYDAIVSLVMMVAARVICFYHPIFDGYLIAAKKAYVSINLITLYSVGNMVVTLGVLWLGGKALEVAVVNFIAALIFTIGFWAFVYKTNVAKETRNGVFRRDYLKMLSSKGLGYLMTPIWQALLFQGTTLIVRIVLGPVAVTAFNTARTVARSVNQLYTIVISAMMAELQLAFGEGRREDAKKLFRVSLGVIVLTASIGSILLMIWGGDLYQLWTHKSVLLPEEMLKVLCLGILFNAFWWPASFVFQAANLPGVVAKAGLIGSFVTIILCYWLSSLYGLTGAAAATVAIELIMVVMVIPKACHILDQSFRGIFVDMILDFRNFAKFKRGDLL